MRDYTKECVHVGVGVLWYNICMKLYHGSDVVVTAPKIILRAKTRDFGAGFYTTSSKEQALRWAKAVSKRNKTLTPKINVYEFNEVNLEGLNVLSFPKADGDWLDFVVVNRKNLPIFVKRDLIIGPVANDTTITVIDDYIDGKYTKEEAIRRLEPQNLTDQYAFLSDVAISRLKFIACEEVS